MYSWHLETLITRWDLGTVSLGICQPGKARSYSSMLQDGNLSPCKVSAVTYRWQLCWTCCILAPVFQNCLSYKTPAVAPLWHGGSAMIPGFRELSQRPRASPSQPPPTWSSLGTFPAAHQALPLHQPFSYNNCHSCLPSVSSSPLTPDSMWSSGDP